MNRIACLVVLAALLVSSLSLAIGAGVAQEAGANQTYLVVADGAAEALYVYSSPEHELVAEFSGIAINDHAGFLPLADGRLLFVDTIASELIVLDLIATNGPVISGGVPVPATTSHIAVAPDHRMAAVGSSDERRPLTIVDLESFTSRSFDVEAGEVGLMLGGDPLMLYHRNDALSQVEAYPIAALTQSNQTPTTILPTGAWGHGEAISHSIGHIYMATEDGIDVAAVDGTRLTYHTTIPWDASDRSGGRAFFMRLSMDGQHLISYIADRGSADAPWGDWTNDLLVVDLSTDEAFRIALGPGLVYRFGLSNSLALFYNMHPDGDFAHVVDVDSESPTFGTVTATIPLEPLTNAAGPNESPWDAEGRIAAISPDGSLGYISAGGDGYINVIDLETATVSGRIDTPTPLSGGGYLIAVQIGFDIGDTIGR